MPGPTDPSQQAQQRPQKERALGPTRFGLPTRQPGVGQRLLGGLGQRIESSTNREDGDKYDPKRPFFTFGGQQAQTLEHMFQEQGVSLRRYQVLRDNPVFHGQEIHQTETTIQISAQELFSLASTHNLIIDIGQQVITEQLVRQYLLPGQIKQYEQQRHLQQGQTFEQWEQDVYFIRDMAVQQLQTSFAALEYERLVQQILPGFQLTDTTGSREGLQLNPIDLEGKATLVRIYNTEVAAALATGQARSETQSVLEREGYMNMVPTEYEEVMGQPTGFVDEVPAEVAAAFDLPSPSTDLSSSLVGAVESLRESVTSITGGQLRTSDIMATLATHAQTAEGLVKEAEVEETQHEDPAATQPMAVVREEKAAAPQDPHSLRTVLDQAWKLLKRAGIDPSSVTTAPRLPVIRFRRPTPVWDQETLPTSGQGSVTREDMERSLREQRLGPDDPSSHRGRRTR